MILDYEALLEVSYTAQIVPGLTIQPDFQYFWNPGGHAADPTIPTKAGDECGRVRGALHDQLLSRLRRLPLLGGPAILR